MTNLTRTVILKYRIYQIKSFIIVILKWFVEYVLCIFLKINIKFTVQSKHREMRTVLVPLMHGLGDAIISTIILRELKNIFPKKDILCLTTNRTHDLLTDDFPEIDFITISSVKDLRSLRGQSDLMILPSRNIDHYFIALIIKPGQIVGYNYNLKILRKESHIQRAIRLLESLGHENWQIPYLNRSVKNETLINKFFHDDMRSTSMIKIVMIVGGRWRSKTYKFKYYHELITRLKTMTNVRIILTGKDSSDLIHNYHDLGMIINLIDKTDIQQLRGIIGISDLIIGPDGGVLNMAMAMRKRIVGIFSSVDPGTIVPESYSDMIIFEKQCPFQPCYNEEHEPFCPFDDPPCIDLEPRMVFEKIKKQLELLSDEKS